LFLKRSFLVIFFLLVDCRILVLLVFGDLASEGGMMQWGYKIVHVALSLSELHLVHTLAGVPMLVVSYVMGGRIPRKPCDGTWR